MLLHIQASPEELDVWMKSSSPENQVPDSWAAQQLVEGNPQVGYIF